MDESVVPSWEGKGDFIHYRNWANVTINLHRMSTYVYSGEPRSHATRLLMTNHRALRSLAHG